MVVEALQCPSRTPKKNKRKRKKKEKKKNKIHPSVPWGWSLAARLKMGPLSIIINWQRREPAHQVWVTLSTYQMYICIVGVYAS